MNLLEMDKIWKEKNGEDFHNNHIPPDSPLGEISTKLLKSLIVFELFRIELPFLPEIKYLDCNN